MTDIGRRGEAASRMLETAEAATPVEAVEVVTRELGAALGARRVSFLIADLSGRALVRLAHVVVAEPAGRPHEEGEDRRDVEESAVQIAFDGGPVEQVLRAQELRLLPPGETTWAGCARTSGRCSRR